MPLNLMVKTLAETVIHYKLSIEKPMFDEFWTGSETSLCICCQAYNILLSCPIGTFQSCLLLQVSSLKRLAAATHFINVFCALYFQPFFKVTIPNKSSSH